MILVVVNKKKCVFFCFSEILAFFFYFCFLSSSRIRKEKSRVESKDRLLDVT